jgi:hypothetical protein
MFNGVNSPHRRGLVITASCSVFLGLYSVWLILVPFYPGGWLEGMFPDRRWAIQIPVVMGVMIMTGILVFIGNLLIKNSRI